MKKIMMALALVAAVVSAEAASVDWKVAGTADQENYTVYLMTSIGEYSSVTELAAAAVGSDVIAKHSRSYYASATSANAEITKEGTYYFAIVSGEGATTFNYVEATGLAASVYDPNAQETSPGAFSTISAANILSGTQGSFGSVPEPTSGLLLLLGMAGLALRRKQK